jgi:hypothetical protein
MSESLWFSASFALRYTITQSGPLLMIGCCIFVFYWNIVSIPSDSLVMEDHDYAYISKEISVGCQSSYQMYLMTQNAHPHEISKKNIFVS